jgi:hypothetical protein
MQERDPRVLALDAPGERGRARHHRFHRSHEPLDHVHVVARLVHEGPSVELPRPAPGRQVVVRLRPVPAHRGVGQIDATEATHLHRALEELDGGIEAVLLDDEELHARLVARSHERVGVLETGGHGLLRDHVHPALGRHDAVARVEAARSADGHYVCRHFIEHARVAREPGHAPLLTRRTCALLGLVAHGNQPERRLARDGIEMTLADTAAADDRYGVPLAGAVLRHAPPPLRGAPTRETRSARRRCAYR